jgi:hypothetical protein
LRQIKSPSRTPRNRFIVFEPELTTMGMLLKLMVPRNDLANSFAQKVYIS